MFWIMFHAMICGEIRCTRPCRRVRAMNRYVMAPYPENILGVGPVEITFLVWYKMSQNIQLSLCSGI